jgi:hypothetical protein
MECLSQPPKNFQRTAMSEETLMMFASSKPVAHLRVGRWTWAESASCPLGHGKSSPTLRCFSRAHMDSRNQGTACTHPPQVTYRGRLASSERWTRTASDAVVSIRTNSSNRANSGNRYKRRGPLNCSWWPVIHLWAGGARRIELKAVHLWVNRRTSPSSPRGGPTNGLPYQVDRKEWAHHCN